MRKNSQADIVRSLSSKQLIFHLCLTQIILLFIAFILGFILFKNTTLFILFRWDISWVVLGIMNGIAVVALDLALMKIVPKRYYDDGGINEKLFANMKTWKIACLTLFIAIAEEILFRGVIQTKFGLIVASIVFAVIHIRYWSHWFLMLNVVILSFWVGLIYVLSGHQLLPVIAMHFTIDFLLGLYISRNSSHINDKEGI